MLLMGGGWSLGGGGALLVEATCYLAGTGSREWTGKKTELKAFSFPPSLLRPSVPLPKVSTDSHWLRTKCSNPEACGGHLAFNSLCVLGNRDPWAKGGREQLGSNTNPPQPTR